MSQLRTPEYEAKLEHLRECRRSVVNAEIALKQLVCQIMTQRTTFRVGQVIASKAVPDRPYAIIERITCQEWQNLQETDVAQLVIRKIRQDGHPSMLTQRLRDPSRYMLYKGKLNFDPKTYNQGSGSAYADDITSTATPNAEDDEL